MMNKNLSVQKKRGNEPWFSLQDEIKDLFSRFSDEWPDLAPMNQKGFVPHIDVKDDGDKFLVTAEVPGLTEKDINLTLDQNVLTLEGEKKSEYKDEKEGYYKSEISYGHFYRQIPLNENVDEDKVEASYRDGVLKINLPKRPGSQKNKKISINTQKSLH
jgi:HSP20 family protein